MSSGNRGEQSAAFYQKLIRRAQNQGANKESVLEIAASGVEG